jgi:hypothetical protein
MSRMRDHVGPILAGVFLSLMIASCSNDQNEKRVSQADGSRIMNDEQIGQLLERLGQAVSSGDFKGISSCWEFPALVFLTEEGMMVRDSGEMEKLFAQAAEAYKKQGITSTKPKLERVDKLNERLTAVDVRWPSFDASGTEKSSERSHYIVQFGKDGLPRIRVALTRTR